MALMEVLAALLVLALGIAGLAWAQQRLLAEGRTTLARAAALRLAADLADRMMANREAALAGRYALAWDEQPTAPGCGAGCSDADLAQADLADWRADVQTGLPGGNATVFRLSADPRQIGIALAWTAAEDAAADDLAYVAPFAVRIASPGEACPQEQLCHVSYVQP